MESLIGLDYIIDANKRLFYIYILSSLAIAIVFLYFKPKLCRINTSSKLWLHESAKLDYTYFFISNLIKGILIIPLMISAKSVALITLLFLTEYFGYTRLILNYEATLFLYSITVFIVSDFTRYILHRLLHKIPILWEFHKVHHSAKVLTPFTFYRVHPIENILFGLRYALTIGFVTGVFIYFFGAKIGLIEIFGVNGIIVIFSLIGSNLRHSHIPLAYPRFLEKIFISPKMHQIHHSTHHFNKNYGGYLALWDWAFNTLKPSIEVKKLTFGIKKEQMKHYQSISQLLFYPFKNITKTRKKNETIKSFKFRSYPTHNRM